MTAGKVRTAIAVASMMAATAPSFAQDAHDHSDMHEHAEALFPRSTNFDFEAPLPGSYDLPVIKSAPDGWVLNEAGERIRLKSLMAGRVVLLSFIYTRCSDSRGCPLSTGVLNDIQYATEAQPGLAEDVRLISLSFDPAYDTPEMMEQYRPRADGTGVPWYFLTTEGDAQLRPILEGYGQTVDRATEKEDDGTGVIFHLLRVYLIDRDGQIRNIYGLGYLDPRLLIADIGTLLLEEEGAPAE